MKMISKVDQSSVLADPPHTPEATSTGTMTDFQKIACLQAQGDDALRKVNYEEAVHFYTQGLLLDAKDCQLLSCRSLALIQLKQYEAARVDAELLIQIRPEAPQNHYLLSLANRYLGHLKIAFQSLLRCLELDETHRNEIVKDLYKATKKLCNIETQDKHSDEKGLDGMLLKIGYLLCEAALHELCIQLVSSAVQLCQSDMSDSVRMQFHLIHANCYSVTNNKDMARTAYENCLKLALRLRSTEEQIKSCAGLAEAHMIAGRPEEAIRYYLQLLAILEQSDQESRDHHSGYERQLSSIREFWSSEREVSVYLNLTKAYWIIHQYQKALVFGKKYLEYLIGGPPTGYCQDVTSAYYQVAKLQEKLGLYNESVINYQQYCELSKMLGNSTAAAEAHGAMGVIHTVLGNYDLAMTHAHQSFNLSRSIGERQLRLAALIRLGDIYRATENFEEAANWYQQAWDHDSRGDDPKLKCQAALGLAGVYKGTAQHRHALYFYEQALEAAEDAGEDELIYKCKFKIASNCQFSYSVKELMKGCKAFKEVIAYYNWLSRRFRFEGIALPKETNGVLLESYDGIQSILEKLGDSTKTLQYAEAGRRHRFLTFAFRIEQPPAWSNSMDVSSGSVIPSMEELCSILDVISGPVLYYSLVETGLYLWVLKAKEGVVHFHATSSVVSEAIHGQICQFLQLLKSRSLLYETEARNIPKRRLRQTSVEKQKKRRQMSRSSCKDSEAAGSLPEDEKEIEHWKQMYLLLFGPVTELLEELQQGSNLLIVPDKHLIQIPFANLPDLKNKKLGERFCVTLAPSLFAIETASNQIEDKAKNKAEAELGSAVRSGAVSTMAMLEHMGGSHQELCGLQKLGLMDTVSHLVNCTSTNTIVARSPYLIPPFKQVFCRSQALVVGSPYFSSPLSLWGRVWKPWGPLIGAQKEVIKVAEYLQTEAIMGEDATKKRVLSQLPEMTVVHIATYGSWEDGVLVFTPHPPPAAGELVEERSYLLTIPEILELELKARIVVLSSCGDGGTNQDPVVPLELPTAFLRAGASTVLMQIKPVPVQASLTFYHHFYIALWSGSYITSAMEYAKYQLQNDTRFGRYWCNFVLLGLDMFVNLLDVKHGMLHQKMENAEEELVQSTKQDWLNPVPYTSPVTDQKALLLEIQRSLEELIVNQGSMSSVLKLLHLLMTEAIKRLVPNNTDNVTVKLTANIISIPGVSSMLNLLGFQFQSLAPVPSKMGDRTVQLPCEQAAMGDVSNHFAPPISHAHPIAVIFPHWNPDRLLGVAQRAVAALIDLSACPQCVNALIWILPLSCDRLEQLISLLEMCQSPPTVCPQLTDKEVANLWNEPHVRDFLQVIGYEQAGKYLFHNPRDLNRSLLLGSLNLFLALRPEPLQRFPELDLLQNASDSVRDQQSRQESQKTRAQGEEQPRQEFQEPLAQREEQSGQGLQEQSTPGVEECRPDPQEASASRKKRSRHGPQETSVQQEEKSRQDPPDTSAGTMRDKKTKPGPLEGSVDSRRVRKTKQSSPESLADTGRDKKNKQGPPEGMVDTKRDKKTKQGSPESLSGTGRDKKNKQGPPEVSTDIARDKETRQEPQENLLDSMKDEKTKHDPQESSEDNLRDKPNMQGPQEDSADTVRDKKNRQGPQEDSADTVRDKKNRQGPQEDSADTVRDKKNRQGPQKTTTPRNKKNRPGPLEITAARNKRTKHDLQEASGTSNKQTEQDTQETVADSETTAHPSGKSRIQLNSLKPLLVLRRQDSCPKKVKVKGPRTPSTAQIPFDTSATTSQNAPLRPAAQELIKDQEENVRHRHRAAVKDLFLPFIDPLP
ncbi:tetratricopeptide repeat protein 28-like isoform X2 [Scyliorhinus canicula]|uniref:tetratricopeptide repeat protein 28-like isoform X2 n=1 Tax=Scyliorhinus canicula TaxID=7830 RepID=UPI0018F664C7|nr:tetratricopeptide repeat protein 28-like isoform X2 [Scyliorhinus canicula]